MPRDADGNPVAVKRWDDPDYVEAEISFLRENFECVKLLEEDGRDAYPGTRSADTRGPETGRNRPYKHTSRKNGARGSLLRASPAGPRGAAPPKPGPKMGRARYNDA